MTKRIVFGLLVAVLAFAQNENSRFTILPTPTRSAAGTLVFQDTSATPKSVTVQAPGTITTSYTLKLPVALGTGGCLYSNSTGQVTFTTCSATGGSVAAGFIVDDETTVNPPNTSMGLQVWYDPTAHAATAKVYDASNVLAPLTINASTLTLPDLNLKGNVAVDADNAHSIGTSSTQVKWIFAHTMHAEKFEIADPFAGGSPSWNMQAEVDSNTNQLWFKDSTNTNFLVFSRAFLGIPTNLMILDGSLVPTTDNVSDLGGTVGGVASGAVWRSLHLGTSLYMGSVRVLDSSANLAVANVSLSGSVSVPTDNAYDIGTSATQLRWMFAHTMHAEKFEIADPFAGGSPSGNIQAEVDQNTNQIWIKDSTNTSFLTFSRAFLGVTTNLMILDGSLVPTTDNVSDLGGTAGGVASGAVWRSLHLGTGLYMGSTLVLDASRNLTVASCTGCGNGSLNAGFIVSNQTTVAPPNHSMGLQAYYDPSGHAAYLASYDNASGLAPISISASVLNLPPLNLVGSVTANADNTYDIGTSATQLRWMFAHTMHAEKFEIADPFAGGSPSWNMQAEVDQNTNQLWFKDSTNTSFVVFSRAFLGVTTNLMIVDGSIVPTTDNVSDLGGTAGGVASGAVWRSLHLGTGLYMGSTRVLDSGGNVTAHNLTVTGTCTGCPGGGIASGFIVTDETAVSPPNTSMGLQEYYDPATHIGHIDVRDNVNAFAPLTLSASVLNTPALVAGGNITASNGAASIGSATNAFQNGIFSGVVEGTQFRVILGSPNSITDYFWWTVDAPHLMRLKDSSGHIMLTLDDSGATPFWEFSGSAVSANASNTDSLGSAGDTWKYLYLGSGLYMGGAQVLDSSANLAVANVALSGSISVPTDSTYDIGARDKQLRWMFAHTMHAEKMEIADPFAGGSPSWNMQAEVDSNTNQLWFKDSANTSFLTFSRVFLGVTTNLMIVDGSIVPTGDNVSDLGGTVGGVASGAVWRSLHLGTGLYMGSSLVLDASRNLTVASCTGCGGGSGTGAGFVVGDKSAITVPTTGLDVYYDPSTHISYIGSYDGSLTPTLTRLVLNTNSLYVANNQVIDNLGKGYFTEVRMTGKVLPLTSASFDLGAQPNNYWGTLFASAIQLGYNGGTMFVDSSMNINALSLKIGGTTVLDAGRNLTVASCTGCGGGGGVSNGFLMTGLSGVGSTNTSQGFQAYYDSFAFTTHLKSYDNTSALSTINMNASSVIMGNLTTPLYQQAGTNLQLANAGSFLSSEVIEGDAGAIPAVIMQRSNGSVGFPGGIANGDIVGLAGSRGYWGYAWASSTTAAMGFLATENWGGSLIGGTLTPTNLGTDIIFTTTAATAATALRRLQISNAAVFAPTPPYDLGTATGYFNNGFFNGTVFAGAVRMFLGATPGAITDYFDAKTSATHTWVLANSSAQNMMELDDGAFPLWRFRGSVTPASDQGWNLGSGSARWLGLYAMGATLSSSLSLSWLGGTQCLHVVGGIVSGTGTDCGSGGGGWSGGTVSQSILPNFNNSLDLGGTFQNWNNAYINTLHVNSCVGSGCGSGGGGGWSGGTVTQSILPSGNNTLDLGSSSQYWRNGYISNLTVGSCGNCWNGGFVTTSILPIFSTLTLGSSSFPWNEVWVTNLHAAGAYNGTFTCPFGQHINQIVFNGGIATGASCN